MFFKFLTQFKKIIVITKPGITRAQVLTVSIGFFLANQSILLNLHYFYLVIGTYFVSSAACAANSMLEKDIDSKMNRTKNRPMPSNQVSTKTALILIVICLLVGLFLLQLINLSVLFVAVLTFITYVFVYTPMKKYSWLNTPIGAIPGALPLIGGWFAAGTPLHLAVISLFFTLFCWQIPHFYALSIMYYEDYKSANLKMLPLYKGGISATKRQIIFFTLLMAASSIYPFFIHFLGIQYLIGMVILSIVFIIYATKAIKDLKMNAKKLFILSIIYLPLWFILIIIDILLN